MDKLGLVVDQREGLVLKAGEDEMNTYLLKLCTMITTYTRYNNNSIVGKLDYRNTTDNETVKDC